jgi:hypothetical protein
MSIAIKIGRVYGPREDRKAHAKKRRRACDKALTRPTGERTRIRLGVSS